MDVLQLAAILIVLSAGFGIVNHHLLRLPRAIGILLIALLASMAVLALGALFPEMEFVTRTRTVVAEIDFPATLLEGMLGLLLFAGALHVDFATLRRQAGIVLLMATIGVGLSTLVFGLAFALITGFPLLVCLTFGALISPTDPVAVLGVLRDAELEESLETKIAGESLFNDGVGYTVFLVLAGLAFGAADTHATGFSAAAMLLAREALGGILLGLAAGWLVFMLMRRIDDPQLEILMTLALVLGAGQLAALLHVSMPLMAVTAGLLIGDVGTREGMSERTRSALPVFWHTMDELLNAVLFLIIGFEVLTIAFHADFIAAMLGGLVLALAGRLAAVAIPVLILRPFRGFSAGVIPIMTWGGIKGGISVALALMLPDSEWTPMILATTYAIVVFSIIVQGLTVGRLARHFGAGQSGAGGQ